MVPPSPSLLSRSSIGHGRSATRYRTTRKNGRTRNKGLLDPLHRPPLHLPLRLRLRHRLARPPSRPPQRPLTKRILRHRHLNSPLFAPYLRLQKLKPQRYPYSAKLWCFPRGGGGGGKGGGKGRKVDIGRYGRVRRGAV